MIDLVSSLRGSLIAAFVILSTSQVFGEIPTSPPFNILKPSTTGVPGSEVRVMDVDPDGNLWIASRWPFWFDIGIAMLPADELEFSGPLPGGGFETGLWQVWSNEDHPIPSVYVDDLAFSGDGVVWIASEGGLTRFDRHAATPEATWQTWNAANSPLTVNGVSEVETDSAGHVWMVNSQINGPLGKLFEYDPAGDQWTPHPLTGGVSGLEVGAGNQVFVTHESKTGFSTFDGTSWTYQGGGATFASVRQDPSGNLWFIASSGGPWRWNGAGYKSWPSLGANGPVTGLSIGLDGAVFVSTWYGPVFKIVNDVPQFFVDAEGLPRSVIERPNGDIFINNYGSTLALGRVRQYTADGQLLRRMNTFNAGLPDYFVDNIQTDHTGNMWFSTGEAGLTRMLGSDGSTPTRWRNFGNHNDFSEPYPWAGNEPMYSMFEDDDGFIWMGGNGIGRWDPATGEFLDFWNWQNSSLGVDSFVRIIADGNGDIWAFSDYTGGFHYNAQTNDWEQHLFGAAFTTANYVNDATLDIDGNLWVVTDTGLHVYNGSTWFAIGIHHGAPISGGTAVKADPAGGIWIGGYGLTHYVDGVWTQYTTDNSPIPANQIHGLAVRSDGLVGFTSADFSQPVIWPNGVVLFDGTNWEVYSYGETPLSHYQITDVEFDIDGDLWVSTVSEGVVEIVLHEEPTTLLGDLNSDSVVDGADLGLLLSSWGDCPRSCSADLNGDGLVNGADLGLLLGSWS